MSATLQTLARPEAERLAREAWTALATAVCRDPSGAPAQVGFAAVGDVPRAFVDAHLALLCDLRRPASLSWWRAWLAVRVGLDTSCGVHWYEDQSDQDHPCFWLDCCTGGINFCALPKDDDDLVRHVHAPGLSVALADVDDPERRRVVALVAAILAVSGGPHG